MHRRKAQAFLASARRMGLELPAIAPEELRALAEEPLARATPEQRLFPISIEELVADHAVQILLETCRPSLYALNAAFVASGVRSARAVIRKRILAAISAMHLSLARECARRIRVESGAVTSDHEPLRTCANGLIG